MKSEKSKFEPNRWNERYEKGDTPWETGQPSSDVMAYLETLRRFTRLGTLGLVLTGNAREPHDPGPPVVAQEQIRTELGRLSDVVHLREFRFDQVEAVGTRFLGWSCLLRRKAD
jgi:hypothetical protein